MLLMCSWSVEYSMSLLCNSFEVCYFVFGRYHMQWPKLRLSGNAQNSRPPEDPWHTSLAPSHTHTCMDPHLMDSADNWLALLNPTLVGDHVLGGMTGWDGHQSKQAPLRLAALSVSLPHPLAHTCHQIWRQLHSALGNLGNQDNRYMSWCYQQVKKEVGWTDWPPSHPHYAAVGSSFDALCGTQGRGAWEAGWRWAPDRSQVA